MFQDSAGTTPVTADGQPVGLILDKSKGLTLGPELVPATYSGVVSGGFSISSSSVTRDGVTSGGNAQLGLISAPILGRTYKITLTASGISGDSTIIRIGSLSVGNYANIETPGVHSFYLSAEATAVYLAIAPYAGSVGAIVITNVSVEELAGNHAVAPSDAARPLKTSTGLSDWINYDAVDDVLNSTFPSSLGSSCTVCRANVGAAPTILTAQTIGTSYADSTDHAGLIIINRALTGQETTDVTAWLTAKGATA